MISREMQFADAPKVVIRGAVDAKSAVELTVGAGSKRAALMAISRVEAVALAKLILVAARD